jgi:hypothetical protein
MYFLQIFIDIFYFTHLYASLQSPIPKFCKNCKYFIPDDPWFGTGKEFGKCKLFQELIKEDDRFLVTGEKTIQKPQYNYCSVARNNKLMCGREGKFYKRKHDPEEDP